MSVGNPEFVAEAQEIVEALNRDLIAVEQELRDGADEVDPDRINTLFEVRTPSRESLGCLVSKRCRPLPMKWRTFSTASDLVNHHGRLHPRCSLCVR